MTGPAVIRAEGLVKIFRIGEVRDRYPTLRGALAAGTRRAAATLLMRRRDPAAEQLRHVAALDGVSFEVARGEIVGVIGANGSGKSTLLRILSRITYPTAGRASIRGRVAALLEAGTGFHPELTGRENIYLNGAILGMRRAEIRSKLDEIVAFAEVGRFIDTPVKHYSTGMHTRLGYAVAAHLEPEILLLDEILAGGDAAFHRKCLDQMSTGSARGRTVLFVSHNMLAVQSLCDRVIWLRSGRIAGVGAPSQVIAAYLRSTQADLRERAWPDRGSAPGNEQVRLRRAALELNGRPGEPVTVATPFALAFEYWNENPAEPLDLSLRLYNEHGVLVFDVGRTGEPLACPDAPGPVLLRDVCRVPAHLLNDGRHRVELHVSRNQRLVYQHPDLLVFDVHDDGGGREQWYGRWPGVVRPRLAWHTERAAPPPDRTT
jgi:lipopolysaccharide transport system ATP-binding protein